MNTEADLANLMNNLTFSFMLKLPNPRQFNDRQEQKDTTNDQDADDDIPAEMTASYSEISFHDNMCAGPSSAAGEPLTNINSDRHQSTKMSAHSSSPQRPASLSYNNRRKGII